MEEKIMKISDILSRDGVKLSFEVFPPKTDSSFDSVKKAVGEIAGMYPSFMSVTYGAGGGTSRYTLSIAKSINEIYSVPTIAHLTCISSTKQTVEQRINEFKENGIENILALRGDIPSGGLQSLSPDYLHATDLIPEIKAHGDFCIGCACYPEGHPESENKQSDLDYLKLKQDCGCDFFTTQMFFDNDIFYSFADSAAKNGITLPIIAGIMPITKAKQLERAQTLSGSYIPERLLKLAEKFGSDDKSMFSAGIYYCIEQIYELISNGFNNIHIYSMNNPACARMIKNAVSPLTEQSDEHR